MEGSKQSHDDIIRKSHERSLKFGVAKDRLYSAKILKGTDINKKLEANRDLIDTANPFLKLLYNFLEGSGFIILLTDKDGCILHIYGDESARAAALGQDMIPGAYMDEKSIGTNAMGTAIKEDLPVQVSAKEHFITAFHQWTCSAAPIHDEKGRIIGTLNLTGSQELVHPHTLGLVVAAVIAIENELVNHLIEKRLVNSGTFIKTVMDTLSFGVIALDTNGKLISANKMAYKLLRYPAGELGNLNVVTLIPDWKKLFETVKSNRIILDEETTLHTSRQAEAFSLNAYPITQVDGAITGMVLSFREMNHVYKVVNKYTGMNARYTFDDLIGESDEMKRMIDFAKTIADSPSTLLIEGESGTGKEVIAQAIHNYSRRSENGFVALNCGAIAPSLIESELFGYDDGAFTGARKGGRPGKFELAHGGTLFLDEIGDMPLDMQVKLLRVIQESAVTRVGGNKLIPVDVRIIAATNRNLKAEVDKCTFRADLFYRLSVIPVLMPPLRDRREDIPILIRYFLHLKSVRLRKNEPEIGKPLFEKLLNYDWPGNIRELENFIEKYVNLNGKLSYAMIGLETIRKINLPELTSQALPKEQKLQSLSEVEHNTITETLAACEHNISHTARILGISRNALYQKLKKYDIPL